MAHTSSESVHVRSRMFLLIAALITAVVASALPMVASSPVQADSLPSLFVGYVENEINDALPGIVVTASTNGAIVGSTTTDAFGAFELDVTATPPDDEGYSLRFVDPTGTYTTEEYLGLFIQPGYDSIFGVTMSVFGDSALSGRVSSGPTSPLSDVYVCAFKTGVYRCTTTDASGDYAFAALPAGVYTVEASLFRYGLQSRGGVVAPSADVDFVLAELPTITGVITADGVPVCGVLVGLIVGDSLGASQYVGSCTDGGTDGRYTFWVQPGTYKLQFAPFPSGPPSLDRYVSEFWNDTTNLVLATPIAVAFGDSAIANADLIREIAIGGTVRSDDPGAPPVSGVTVTAYNHLTGVSVGSTGTNNVGQYRIPLPAGTDQLKLKFSSDRIVEEWWENKSSEGAANTIAVGSSSVVADAIVTRLPVQVISGFVTRDSDNSPVSSAQVTARFASGVTLASPPTTFTNPDGSYRLEVLPGSYVIEFDARSQGLIREFFDEKFSFASATLVDATSTDQVVNESLALGGSISGTVAGLPPGTPTFSPPCVDVYTLDDLLTSVQQVCPSSSTYTFIGLAPGQYKVRAASNVLGFAPLWYDGVLTSSAATTVTVAAGQTTTGINFDFATGPKMSGRVVDSSGQPIANAIVSAAGAAFRSTTTDAGGEFEIRGLLADASGYVVSITAPGFVSEFYDDKPTYNSADLVPFTGSDVALGDIALSTASALVSGFIYEEGSATVPAPNVCAFFNHTVGTQYRACTDSAGAYSVALPVGSFGVYLEDSSPQKRYLSEFETFPAQSNPFEYDSTSGTQTLDMDIKRGNWVTGRVVQEGTTTGQPGIGVQLLDSTGWPVSGGTTDQQGNYFLSAGDGTFGIRFSNANGRFITEYWNDELAAPGDPFVLAGVDRTGIDAALSLGAIVSGTVTASTGNPFPVCVEAKLGGTSTVVASGCIDPSGDYSTTGIPNGPIDITVSAFGFAPFSQRINVVNGADQTVNIALTPALPAAPTNVMVFPDDGSLDVWWSSDSNGGSAITDTRVQVSSNNGATWVWGATALGFGGYASVRSLAPDTTYLVRIRSFNGAGWGPWSVPVSGTTSATLATPPSKPSVVTAVAGNALVGVSWTMASPGTSPIIDTRVQRSSNGGATWQWAATATATATSAFAMSLTNGQSYVFRVRAQNAFGWGPWSDVTGAVVPLGSIVPPPGTVTPPNQIVVDSIVPGGTDVIISWTEPSANNGTLIDTRVQISSDSGATWQWAATALPGTTTVTISVPWFASYLVRLRAQNEAGWGPWSASVLATMIDP